MRDLWSVLFLMSGLLAFQGCLTDKGELVDHSCSGFCDTLGATYVDTMRSIINTNCAIGGCHVTGFAHGDFSSYSGMEASVAFSPGVLEGRIFSGNTSFVMPPDNPLPDSVKAIFQCWICDEFPQQ